MVLSDGSIIKEIEAGRLGIDPFDKKLVQPAGIDLRLGKDFMTWIAGAGIPCIDPSGMSIDYSVNYERVVCSKQRPAFYLYPSQFVLGATFETISMPSDLLGRLEGRSSLGRIGLLVNLNSRFVDPGFEGRITLELYNITNRPIRLLPGMRIAQLSIERLDVPAIHPYGSPDLGSHYQRQSGATPPVFDMLANLEEKGE